MRDSGDPDGSDPDGSAPDGDVVPWRAFLAETVARLEAGGLAIS